MLCRNFLNGVILVPKIEVLPDNIVVESDNDKTILESVTEQGIPQVNACGAAGKCSTCRVWIMEGVENCENRTELEEEMAVKLNFGPEIRLACQTKIKGDLKLRRLVIDDTDLEICNQMFVDRMLESMRPVGEEKEVALMFTDIRGFTSFSERHPPYDVLFLLNRHFHQLYKIIDKNGGTIDNYVGDSLFAIFGLTDGIDKSVFKAVKSGVEILKEIDKMKPYMQSMYGEDFEIGIGVHYGKVVVGEIGPGQKTKKTVIGDNVNIASRIEAANKQAGTRFLVSEDVYKIVEKDVISEDFVRIRIPGKETKYTLYEINGLTDKCIQRSQEEPEDIIHQNGRKYKRFLPTKDLPTNSQLEVSSEDKTILLINHEDDIFAINGRCPHMNMALKGSQINPKTGELKCKWHDACFELQTGKVAKWCKEMPYIMKLFSKELVQGIQNVPQKNLETYPTILKSGFIWISLEK